MDSLCSFAELSAISFFNLFSYFLFIAIDVDRIIIKEQSSKNMTQLKYCIL